MSEDEYDLRKSAEKVGELYPVIMSKTGEVIDGFHRINAKAEWRREVREDIDSPEKVLKARLIANKFRRQVTAEEVRGWINDLAEIALTEHGVVPGEISGWVAEETGYSRDQVTNYLIDKYKKKEFATRINDPNKEGLNPSSVISAVKNIIPEVDVSIPSDVLKEVTKKVVVVDLESPNGLKKAAKALEREAKAKIKAKKTPEQIEIEKAEKKCKQQENAIKKREQQIQREQQLKEKARQEVTKEIKQELRQEVQQDPELRAKIALEERTKQITDFKKRYEIEEPVIDMGQKYHERMVSLFYQIRGWGVPTILSMGEKWWSRTIPYIQGINDWSSFLLEIKTDKPLEKQPEKPMLKVEVDERKIVEAEYQIIKEE